MIKKDIGLFHKNFVSWIIQDNPAYHKAVFKISSHSNFDKSLFVIVPAAFENLSLTDKIYAGYKICGYVYTMEVLQGLLISLVKSVREENDQIRTAFQFLFKDYLIYNYRSTLDILRKNLIDDKLLFFAKSLFEECIIYFENYFKQLRGISVKKEITPYREQTQLRNFYHRKLYADLPKKAQENSIARFFKQTDVNANHWAIRRPGEYRHTPAPLGTISVTSEFPSGEKLNPIYQEYIRRTYQNLTKDEINID